MLAAKQAQPFGNDLDLVALALRMRLGGRERLPEDLQSYLISVARGAASVLRSPAASSVPAPSPESVKLAMAILSNAADEVTANELEAIGCMDLALAAKLLRGIEGANVYR
ncbi:hypothetical protein [Camelimonas lactis]|uniref:hypothetical protein n=1 Tax=Camelimonas lactis TaxID=659006 RepID=UPI0010493802|nr:hypothetical protein [Camelimonas lactis]